MSADWTHVPTDHDFSDDPYYRTPLNSDTPPEVRR